MSVSQSVSVNLLDHHFNVKNKKQKSELKDQIDICVRISKRHCDRFSLNILEIIDFFHLLVNIYLFRYPIKSILTWFVVHSLKLILLYWHYIDPLTFYPDVQFSKKKKKKCSWISPDVYKINMKKKLIKKRKEKPLNIF